jgi:protein-S-isoprenylcysteine O-methyltransferase Ste14
VGKGLQIVDGNRYQLEDPFGDSGMATDDHSEKAERGRVPEVANLGIIRPPFVYLGAIALGLVLHFTWPLRLVPGVVSVPLGATAVLAAVALFLYAVRTFRTAGTPVPGNRPTTTVVRTGPYRYSRNPIYLAFSLLQLGLAFWVNTLWLLVTLVPAVALMSFVVIPREELYLETRFPSDYLAYKTSVRRWL